jgi:hypothetical protein
MSKQTGCLCWFSNFTSWVNSPIPQTALRKHCHSSIRILARTEQLLCEPWCHTCTYGQAYLCMAMAWCLLETPQIDTQKASVIWVHSCTPRSHKTGTLSVKRKCCKWNVIMSTAVTPIKIYSFHEHTYMIRQATTVQGSEGIPLARSCQNRWHSTVATRRIG